MTHRGPFQPLLFCDSVIHGKWGDLATASPGALAHLQAGAPMGCFFQWEETNSTGNCEVSNFAPYQ